MKLWVPQNSGNFMTT